MSTLLETCLVAILVTFSGVVIAFFAAVFVGDAKTQVENGTVMMTRDHDGHKWIIGTIWDNSISVQHHPDCGCEQ